MLSPMAATMPKRSVILPVATPPRPKPSMVRVKASDTAPPPTGRMPRVPDRADPQRKRKPHPCLTGVRSEEGRISRWFGGSVHGRNFVARGRGVKQHGAILGMQMHRNRTGHTSPSPIGHSGARVSAKPESRSDYCEIGVCAFGASGNDEGKNPR